MSAEAGRVFISYVREDAEPVGQLKRQLEAAGIRVWLDTDDLSPGEDWQARIRQAIQEDALVFIACFSQHSAARARSYQYEELTQALGQMRLRRPGDPWLIPVRFAECDLPDFDIGAGRTLRHLQCVDLFGARREENAVRLVTAVLRILWPGAGGPVAGRRHVVGSLARSLAEGSATRSHVLGFFGQPLPEVARFWRGITDRERDNVLALLLGELDEKAADALCAYWETVAADTARYLSRLLEDGEVEAAVWCLSVLSTAPFADAEDHLLSRLLVPRNASAAGERRISGLVSLLRQRLVPRPGTFGSSREIIRSGDSEDWQAALVRSLLLSETESAIRAPRAADWVDWLCLTEPAEREKQSEWITALASIHPGQVAEHSASCIQALIRSDGDWAIVVLRLARHADCLPVIIKASCPALVSRIEQVFAGLFKSGDQSSALLAELETGLQQCRMLPEPAAIVDVIRVIFGVQPRGFPAGHGKEFLTGYVNALGEAFRLMILKSNQREIQRLFLADVCQGDTLAPSAGYLLRAWSKESDMAPGVAGFLGTMPRDKLLGSAELDAEFWQAMAAYDGGLDDFVEASRLGDVIAEAVRDPATALRRDVGIAGVAATKLAVAMCDARRAGISVEDMAIVLGARNGGRLSPEMLDGVLRELQDFSSGALGAEEHPVRLDLAEFYWRITGGALGDEYGRSFRQYLEKRLGDEWFRLHLGSDRWQV